MSRRVARQGLKVGFYYSPPDWYCERQYRCLGYGTKGTKESPHLGLNHEPVDRLPARPADFEDRYVAYVNGQTEELLTWYGPIDYLWFDGSAGPKVLSLDEIRELQPGIIVNDRQHGRGDVVTSHYEYRLPEAQPAGSWEHCFSMVGAWGYTKPELVLRRACCSKLAQVRAWGGNVLANYGPRPDGEMPDCFYRCMAEMKDWMAHSGVSVGDVEPGPYPHKCNVPVTVRGKTWFAHLLPKTSDGTVTLTETARPQGLRCSPREKSFPSPAARASSRFPCQEICARQWTMSSRSSGDEAFQLVEQRLLALEDLVPGLGQGEPCGTVGFGKGLLSAGVGRPFHGEGVALDRLGVAVALDGPSVDHLAAGLLGWGLRA